MAESLTRTAPLFYQLHRGAIAAPSQSAEDLRSERGLPTPGGSSHSALVVEDHIHTQGLALQRVESVEFAKNKAILQMFVVRKLQATKFGNKVRQQRGPRKQNRKPKTVHSLDNTSFESMPSSD